MEERRLGYVVKRWLLATPNRGATRKVSNDGRSLESDNIRFRVDGQHLGHHVAQNADWLLAHSVEMGVSWLAEGESPSTRDLRPVFVETVGGHASHESVEKLNGSEVWMITPQLDKLRKEEGARVATDPCGENLHG